MSTDGVCCPRCSSERVVKIPISMRKRGRRESNITESIAALEDRFWCSNCGKEFSKKEKRVV